MPSASRLELEKLCSDHYHDLTAQMVSVSLAQQGRALEGLSVLLWGWSEIMVTMLLFRFSSGGK